MGIEFRRAIRNKFYILFSLVNILSIIFGYILLVTIDNLENIRFQDMFESVYTVYTQFGTLLFSSIIIMQFYMDYKEKNIFFYKTLGFSAINYYWIKLCVILSATLIGSGIASFAICMPYHKISLLPVVFLKIESVMMYYSIVISTISFVFSNFLLAFFINLFLWIAGIIISASAEFLKYFAYYDASTSDYKYLLSYLDDSVNNKMMFHQLLNNYIYNFIIFIICLVIVFILRNRWEKNGI